MPFAARTGHPATVGFRHERITLVSYAVYRIPRICEALVRAARRGVKINVVLETPNKIEGQTEYNTIQALGERLVRRISTVYYWPEAQRAKRMAANTASACKMCRGGWSSAFPVQCRPYRVRLHREHGIGAPGGGRAIAVPIEEQFDRLIAMGVLERV